MNVTGGRLPVEPGRVYAITQRVLGTNLTTTPDVVVRDPQEMPFVTGTPPAFHRLLGLTLDRGGVETAAYVRGPETVYVSERILNRSVLVETTLAHEYTHVVQHRTGTFDDLRAVGTSTDAEAVRAAVIEGAAVYTADTYWHRHVRRHTRPVADLAQVYRNASGATWFAVAQYRFGYRYVHARTDSPADLPRVYRTPPRTSEAIIHRFPPGAERPVNLTVRVTGESREWFEMPSRTRMGELFVRSVLRTERPAREAARGADGWGNDARLAFTGEDREETGYVWILRWDDATNASEFGEVFRSYLDGRATREDGLWLNGSAAYRYERIDTETVAVFVGPPGFVGNASATVSDAGTVTVSPPDP